MDDARLREHWDSIYRSRQAEALSWFQAHPSVSLELIRSVAPDVRAGIIDVGGGASTLVDALLAAGYARLTVMDISAEALQVARRRLGPAADTVTWLVADVLEAELAPQSLDVWHDRAVFHFLTRESDRRRYIEQVERAVRPGGHVLVATFADDGPTRCSGLEVARYSADLLHAEFGGGYRLERSVREDHVTPWGTHQGFVYCMCRWKGS